MSSPVELGPYCGQCGAERDGGDHSLCASRAALEPPRYCANCQRRLVVQVVPRGWTARCSRHGTASHP